MRRHFVCVLCKAHALVPGYRTLNVLGVTPQRRGILYHRLFSSQEADFISEPAEVQHALVTVHEAMQGLPNWRSVTWITDRGLDDVAVWRTIWEQAEHVVCRVKHTERLIQYQTPSEQWREGAVASAVGAMRLWISPRPRWSPLGAAKRTPKRRW